MMHPMKANWIYAIVLIGTAIILGALPLSCSDPNPNAPTGYEGEIDDTVSPYPHSDDYQTPATHGIEAMQIGNEVCIECHGEPGQEG